MPGEHDAMIHSMNLIGGGMQKNAGAHKDKRKRGGPKTSSFVLQCGQLLLGGSDDVLGSLGYAELDNGLGLDLDGRAGLRVAADARLALCLYEAADAGDNKHAVLLGFLDGGLSQQVQEGSGLLVGQFHLLGQMPCECGLCESCCHYDVLLLGEPFGLPLLTGFRRENAYRM